MALLLIFMVSGPLYNAQRDDWDVDLQAQALLGAPAPGTFWLLLMVAGQFGPLDWVLSLTRYIEDAVIVVVIIAMIVQGLICLLRRRIGNDHLFARTSSWINWALYRAGVILLMSVLSIAVAAIGPMAGVISWLASTESDAYRDMKLRNARERFERRKPDGAVQVPKAISRPGSNSESEFGKRVVGPSDARLAVDRSRGSAVYVAGGFELVGYSARRSAYLTGSGLGEALGAIGGIKAQLDLFGGAH